MTISTDTLTIPVRTRYKIVSSDFSAQEPRVTAYYSKDENMINAYKEGKDLYAVIASIAFNRKYEDCLEHYVSGTRIIVDGEEIIAGHKTHVNKEGKSYRNQAKTILLGIEYGRGAASVGEQIGKTQQEAQEIIDNFFNSFPGVKRWIDETNTAAYNKGYVEDLAGRRRRLPGIQLPKYEIKNKDTATATFNPIIGCSDRIDYSLNRLKNKYMTKLNKARGRKEVDQIQKEAEVENIIIKDNTGYIAQAERQAVNSRVQGAAATITKNAMLAIYRDQKLRDLGAYLVNTVHDEILIEAPEAVAQEAADRLVWLMIDSAKKLVPDVPMSCDATIEPCWYISEFRTVVESEFKHMLEEIKDPMIAFEHLCEERSESTRDQLYELVGGFLPSVPEGVDTSYSSGL